MCVFRKKRNIPLFVVGDCLKKTEEYIFGRRRRCHVERNLLQKRNYKKRQSFSFVQHFFSEFVVNVRLEERLKRPRNVGESRREGSIIGIFWRRRGRKKYLFP